MYLITWMELVGERKRSMKTRDEKALQNKRQRTEISGALYTQGTPRTIAELIF